VLAPFDDAAQRLRHARQREAEQVLELRGVQHLHHVGVVMQVLAHAGQVVQHRDAVLLQVCGRPHARQHQQLRRHKRSRTQQHFASRPHLLQGAALAVFDTHGARALEQDARGVGTGDDLQVGARKVRREVALGRAVALAVLVRDLVQAHAFLRGTVEVGVVRIPRLHTRFGEVVAEAVGRAQVRHVEGAALGVPGISTALVVLGAQEVGLHILPAPARVALRGPVVVVGMLAPDVDHGVDGAGAPQHLAAWLIAAPVVQRRLRRGVEAPAVQLELGHHGQPGRAVDEHAVVGRPRLQQAHAHCGVLSQTAGQHRACRAAADHDVVEHVVVSPPPCCAAVGLFWVNAR